MSTAKQEKYKTIKAHVIEVKTDLPLAPDVQPDDLTIKGEYADFLDATGILDLGPTVDLSVTIPNQYEKLMAQIPIRECSLKQVHKGDIPFQNAVEDEP